MPAALREWKNQKYRHDQIYEDLGDNNNENENIGPLVRTIFENAEELGDLEELWEKDSKYQRLSSELKKYLKSNPKDKIVIFAYFRPTLYYLHERLASEGISSLVIVGGGTQNKYEVMEEFKNPKGPNILLASEVASEGVDLQFSRVLINYDLPWNPMKVEQRVGRIDRLGQMSPVITIWNLFYANTIDERIYDRLFIRLNIFEHTLGGLEAVLGDEIKKLTMDLLKGQLTPEQEEARISQTEQALSNLIEEERKLEQNANNLIAHGDYILNQVKAVKELGRCINGKDLWIYVRDFFNAFYPGCEFRQIENDKLVFKVKLSDGARSELDIFIRNNHLSGQTRILQRASRPMLCEFKNQVSHHLAGENEYINQFHPLIRFVSYKIQKKISHSETIYFPSVSIRLNSKDLPSLFAGIYLFYVERWTVKGVRDIEKMVYFARPLSSNSKYVNENYLNEKVAEQLVTSAAKNGTDWLSATNMIDVDKYIPLIEEMMDRTEQEYHKYISVLQNENYDRADLQEKTLRLHMQRQEEKLNDVLERHKEKGNHKMIAPTQGLIDKMRARLENKIARIQRKRELQHHRAEVCLGIVQLD
ncbi:MAG: helicase-related protein [Myxococcota bacterium]